MENIPTMIPIEVYFTATIFDVVETKAILVNDYVEYKIGDEAIVEPFRTFKIVPTPTTSHPIRTEPYELTYSTNLDALDFVYLTEFNSDWQEYNVFTDDASLVSGRKLVWVYAVASVAQFAETYTPATPWKLIVYQADPPYSIPPAMPPFFEEPPEAQIVGFGNGWSLTLPIPIDLQDEDVQISVSLHKAGVFTTYSEESRTFKILPEATDLSFMDTYEIDIVLQNESELLTYYKLELSIVDP